MAQVVDKTTAEKVEVAQEAVEEAQSLAPVVVTASQREQQIREAPASISVITRKDLEAKPYTSVTEAVKSVEGVTVVGSSPR